MRYQRDVGLGLCEAFEVEAGHAVEVAVEKVDDVQ